MSEVAPVRIGLVGAGAISAQHVEAVEAVDGARVAAVASATEDRARSLGERLGVPWTTHVDELVARDDVDAVAISSPSGLHPRHALAALRHGKHVLVEKPLALSNEDARLVVEEARRHGLVAATVSQRRFEPVVRAVHDAVSGGALGRLVLIVAEGFYHRPQSYYDSAAWRGTIALDGGVLMNQAIHTIDLLRWIGGPVERVAAEVATTTHDMEAEDVATVSLRFASGALGAIFATTSARTERPTELRIEGELGHIRLVGDETKEWDVPDRPAPAPEPVVAASAGPATWGTNATGYVRQYTDFVAAIRHGRDPAVTAADGAAAVEIVLASYAASASGCAVTLVGGAA